MVEMILAAAKAANVSGALLLAICTHESHLHNIMVPHDGGSPSLGICQIKEDTARMFGYKGESLNANKFKPSKKFPGTFEVVGKPVGLMDPKTNVEYAAKYLAFQESRYGSENWCIISAAYNAGSFIESSKLPGHPKNLKYVRKVQKHLDPLLHFRMVCIQ